ncbi:MAG: hypothetical protein ACLRMW_02890 [[Clostridium] symbiosum]|jgi:hypothetical protein|uniref:hypothetical protein n=1 Tax=Clostridium symbiosum TaxID=1512 RepID=UPI00189858EA|nr:hypothetical protein [[Clostridium] symbiosum]
MNFDKITRMDEAITELELAQGKAFTICDDLFQEFFGESDPKEYVLKVFYNEAKIKNHIVFDYLNRIEDVIKELRGLQQDIEEDYKNSISN